MSFLSVFEEAEVKHETREGPTPANLISQGLHNKQAIPGKYLIASTDVMIARSSPSFAQRISYLQWPLNVRERVQCALLFEFQVRLVHV